MQADRNVLRVTNIDKQYLIKDYKGEELKTTRRLLEDSSAFTSSDFYPYLEDLQA